MDNKTVPNNTPLLIRGGQVLDSDGPRWREADVRVIDGVIDAIGPGLDAGDAEVIDASGQWVAPGLYDTHAHVFDGVSVWGVPAESVGWRTGVTTILDTGTAGATTWPGFRDYFIEPAETRILALLNVSTIGILTSVYSGADVGELVNAKYFDLDYASAIVDENRDRIVGIKVRLSLNLADSEALEALAFERALALAERVNLPLMVHHSFSSISTPETVSRMRPGDVYTHVFHNRPSSILNDGGRVFPEVHRARERGVLFDVGHGSGAFSWTVAEAACQGEGFWPDLLGTDVHRYNLHGPVFNMATTIAKFLVLGMDTAAAFYAASTAGYRALTGEALPDIGEIKVGAPAELSIWQPEEQAVRLYDTHDEYRECNRHVSPTGVVYQGCYRALDGGGVGDDYSFVGEAAKRHAALKDKHES